MERLIKSKNEIILGAAGIIFLIFLIFAFSWTINFLASSVSKSLTSGKSGGSAGNFDLTGAQRLNLKGLGPAGTSQN